jgi:hypothetical protein
MQEISVGQDMTGTIESKKHDAYSTTDFKHKTIRRSILLPILCFPIDQKRQKDVCCGAKATAILGPTQNNNSPCLPCPNMPCIFRIPCNSENAMHATEGRGTTPPPKENANKKYNKERVLCGKKGIKAARTTWFPGSVKPQPPHALVRLRCQPGPVYPNPPEPVVRQ